MINKITITGQYVGNDKRGIIVGGIPFTPGSPAKGVEVTEETYKKLVQGVENGWFKILSDTSKEFYAARNNVKNGTFSKPYVAEKVEFEAIVSESVVEKASEKTEEPEVPTEEAEEAKEVEVKKTTRKTTKKAVKTEDETE